MTRRTTRTLSLAIALVLAWTLASCGGDGDSGDDVEDPAGATEETEAGGGETMAEDADTAEPAADAPAAPADAPPAGQATIQVDGLDLTFDMASRCDVEDDEFGFGFAIGDNEITLSGGGFLADAWNGNAILRIAESEDEPGPVQYTINITENVEGLQIGGGSVSWTGPVEKVPAGSGEGEPVGEGTFAYSC